MRDHGKNIKRVIEPGVWIDLDDALHINAREFCIGHGLEPTPQIIELVEEEFRQLARSKLPRASLIEVFDLPPQL